MNEPRDEFYVGYLPLPAGIGRFIKPVAAALLALGIGVAVALASQQRDPGDGQWKSAQVVQLTCTVHAQPYPLVFWDDGGVQRTSLTVEAGKRTAERLLPYDGKAVTIRGVWLVRDRTRMFELTPDPVASSPSAAEQPLHTKAGFRITVEGEVIDPKCYLGAMKPGEGKTHKACAALCLAGGVPPMLRTLGPDGKATLHLLIGPEGQPIGRDLIPVVGEPVIVTGVSESWGDLPILRIDPNAVVPLR